MSDENFRNFSPGIELVPQPTSNVSSQGDMDVDTTSTKINYHNGTTSSHVVTETQSSQGASRLQNKDLDASNVEFVDPNDTTKAIKFQASGASTGAVLTNSSNQTTSQNLAIPNVSSGDSYVTNNTVATLTNKSISGSNNTITNIPYSAFTGVLPIANGGTNATTASAAYNNLSPMTTTGDIEYEASAGVAARLPIGTSGQVLTVSGGVPTWAAATGGFTNPMTTLGDIIIGGTSGTPTRLGATTNGYVLTLVSGSPAWQASSGGGSVTIGTFDSQTPNANALTAISSTLYAQSASATNPGMVNTAAQTFAGSKTFNSMISTPGINMAQITTPATPATGFNDIYFKSDGNVYILNSVGVETKLSAETGAFYQSSQITTQTSGGVSSTTFVTPSNSPAFTFTPTTTATYKVYSPCNISTPGTDFFISRVFNTSGGAVLLSESQGFLLSSGGQGGDGAFCQSLYTLTAGTTYVFDLQLKSTSATGVYLDGSKAPFYMFAETVGVSSGSGGSTYTFTDSLVNSGGSVKLVGDSPSPGNSKYYGTNGSGTLGYYPITSGGGGVGTPVFGPTQTATASNGAPVTFGVTITTVNGGPVMIFMAFDQTVSLPQVNCSSSADPIITITNNTTSTGVFSTQFVGAGVSLPFPPSMAMNIDTSVVGTAGTYSYEGEFSVPASGIVNIIGIRLVAYEM